MMDIRAIEQRADSRNQHDIVGSNQFPHFPHSFVGPTRRPRDACYQLRALAALPGTFYGYIRG
jgi:hypothetical protein